MTPAVGLRARPRRLARAAVEPAVGVQLWFAAGAVEVGLRVRSLPDLLAIGARTAGSPVLRWFPAGRDHLSDARLDRLAVVASNWWRGKRACLPLALLRCWLAASVGHDTTVVLGVRRTVATAFTAHAWVEVDGEVYGELVDPHHGFQRLAHFPVTPLAGQQLPGAQP